MKHASLDAGRRCAPVLAACAVFAAQLGIVTPAAAQPAPPPPPVAPPPTAPAPPPDAAPPPPVDPAAPATQPAPPAPPPDATPPAPPAPPLAQPTPPPPAPVDVVPPPPPPPNDKTEAVLRIGEDGIVLERSDKAFQLKLRGYVQADARFFIDGGDSGPPHTFLIRRARPILEGTLFKYFGFRLMPDFGGASPTLQDAYVDIRPLKEISVRVGKFKAPVGLERLASATNILFVERALPTQLVPNRDLGIQVYGDVADGTFTYAVGAFNGDVDAGSNDADTDDGKELAARVFAHPLRPLGIAAVKSLGVGFSTTWGIAEGTLDAPGVASLKTSGQQTFFRYRAGETIEESTVASGARFRFSPQLYWFYGPVGVLGEYVASFQDVTIGGDETRLVHHAFQAAGTVVIGGDASYEGVKPSGEVGNGGLGALEFVGRYHQLIADEDAFPVFANPDAAARIARGFTLGVGWWPHRSFRVMADFDRTTFEGGAADGADRTSENAVLVRTQASW